MFVVFLVALAFLGGGAITYSAMNGPKRRADELVRRLTLQQEEMNAARAELDDRTVAADAREDALRKAVIGHKQRTAEFAAKAAEFGARVIQYDDLAAENRLLKTDLRNLLLRLARYEHGHRETARDLTASADERDRLGAAYLDEVRAAAKKTLTPTNYPAVKQRLKAAFDRVRAAGVLTPDGDEANALRSLHESYEKQVRAAVERDEQARLRETIRDEQRREREAEEAVRRAELERQVVADALAKALKEAGGRHAAEVERLQTQLAEAEAKSRRAISFAQITRSGHIYVISNVGSFGKDVFKIGMTRRQEPMDRVTELGDASVPFPFDVHMMIQTDDAPRLESALHRAFHRRRVNRANPRKEFFRATVEEIAAAVREHHGEVEYTADPQALEYLSSKSMTDEDLREMEDVFAEAERAAAD